MTKQLSQPPSKEVKRFGEQAEFQECTLELLKGFV